MKAKDAAGFILAYSDGCHAEGKKLAKRCERHRRPGVLRTTVLAALACASTTILLRVPLLFPHTSTAKSCLSKFPVCHGVLLFLVFIANIPLLLQLCDPARLQIPTSSTILRLNLACETLLCVLCIALLIHWASIFLLFRYSRWKERYLSVSLVFVGGLTLASSRIIGDSAVIFLQICPAMIDIVVVVCLCLDLYDGSGPDD